MTTQEIIELITNIFNEKSHAEKAAEILHSKGIRAVNLCGIPLEDTKKISVMNALRDCERSSQLENNGGKNGSTSQ